MITKIRQLLSLLQNEINDDCFVYEEYDSRSDRYYERCSGCHVVADYSRDRYGSRIIKHEPDCTTQQIEKLVTDLQSELPDEENDAADQEVSS
jgi:hypothetical protein